MAGEPKRRLGVHIQQTLLAGALTLIPIWITWLVFRFILGLLSEAGSPWVRALAGTVGQYAPALAEWILAPWFESLLAVVLTLVLIYLLGSGARWVVGRRLIGLVESLIGRIPLVHTVYGSTKKLLAALQQKPEHVQRVVLIPFPSPEMKSVGFVTRVLEDQESGRRVATVYVPTTPNPTSGYLEIVPVEQLVSTEWTMDEAMTFIISGGAVAPETLHYDRNDESEPPPDPPPGS